MLKWNPLIGNANPFITRLMQLPKFRPNLSMLWFLLPGLLNMLETLQKPQWSIFRLIYRRSTVLHRTSVEVQNGPHLLNELEHRQIILPGRSMNTEVVVGSILFPPVHFLILVRCPLVVVRPCDLLFSRCLTCAAGCLLHPVRSRVIPARNVLCPVATLVIHLVTWTLVSTKRVLMLHVRPNRWKQLVLCAVNLWCLLACCLTLVNMLNLLGLTL